LCTFVFVCFTWVFFRAQTLDAAWLMVRKMCLFDNHGDSAWSWHVGVLFLVVGLGHVACAKGYPLLLSGDRGRVPGWAYAGIYGVVVFALLLLAPDGTQPFVYFQF